MTRRGILYGIFLYNTSPFKKFCLANNPKPWTRVDLLTSKVAYGLIILGMLALLIMLIMLVMLNMLTMIP